MAEDPTVAVGLRMYLSGWSASLALGSTWGTLLACLLTVVAITPIASVASRSRRFLAPRRAPSGSSRWPSEVRSSAGAPTCRYRKAAVRVRGDVGLSAQAIYGTNHAHGLLSPSAQARVRALLDTNR